MFQIKPRKSRKSFRIKIGLCHSVPQMINVRRADLGNIGYQAKARVVWRHNLLNA
jgi:hypothetical protein